MTKVVITKGESITKAAEDALSGIDELVKLVERRTVAIKPNDTWASRMDTTAVTQPDTLRSIIGVLKRFQPKEIVITGGSGAGDTAEIFKTAGLMRIIEEEHVSFFDHNKEPFIEVDLEYGKDIEVSGPQKKVMVNPRVLEYDTLISLS